MPALQALLPELFLHWAAMPRTSARGRRCGCAVSRRGWWTVRRRRGSRRFCTCQASAATSCGRRRIVPQELAALVELQYRGAMWLHVNGKEWTPYAFLVSKHGGLELDVAKDQATLDALAGALPSLMTRTDQPVAGPAAGCGVFQRPGGAGCDRAAAALAERAGGVQTAADRTPNGRPSASSARPRPASIRSRTAR